MKIGCTCGAWFWHSKECRSKYVEIRPSGALSIDARYYTESPQWAKTMQALKELRQS